MSEENITNRMMRFLVRSMPMRLQRYYRHHSEIIIAHMEMILSEYVYSSVDYSWGQYVRLFWDQVMIGFDRDLTEFENNENERLDRINEEKENQRVERNDPDFEQNPNILVVLDGNVGRYTRSRSLLIPVIDLTVEDDDVIVLE